MDKSKLIEALAALVGKNALPIPADRVVQDAGILWHHAGSIRQLETKRRSHGRLVDNDLRMFDNVKSWCNEIASKYGCKVVVTDAGPVDLWTLGIEADLVGSLVFADLA